MNMDILRATFRYDGRRGKLYKGRCLANAFEKYADGPLVVWYLGEQVKYARICFALAYGYLPKQVRHRNGRQKDNRQANLYDPHADMAAPTSEKGVASYVGVHEVKCQKTGRFRGFRGIFNHGGRRFYTPVVENRETARDLRMLLVAQVEWQALQEKPDHDTRTSGAI
jgi:hypothetical protein